jgi:hypothetical protein
VLEQDLEAVMVLLVAQVAVAVAKTELVELETKVDLVPLKEPLEAVRLAVVTAVAEAVAEAQAVKLLV